MGMGMAISLGSMRVCLHPPQVSHGTPVMWVKKVMHYPLCL